MEKYLSLLKDTLLFSGIDDDEILEMMKCLNAKIVDYPKDTYIVREGDQVDNLGLLLSGNALIIKEDFWGRRNIISGVGVGQCFAETFACASGSILNVSVVTQTPCKVMFLNVKRMLSFDPENGNHNSRIVRNLLSDIANKNIYFSEKLSHLGQKNTREKLLSYLSAESLRHHSREFQIPFSRQQLADYLCVDRSGLSAELGRMQKEGILEFNRNKFRLNGL